jgi:hypothetical protein
VQWQGLRAVGNGFIANYSPPAERTENLAIAQVRGHYIQFATVLSMYGFSKPNSNWMDHDLDQA